MGTYPDHETYRALYARYYNGRDIAELLQLLEPLSGARVLDLCGGDGRLALGALERRASYALLVDAEATMISKEASDHPRVHVHVGTVHDALFGQRLRCHSYDRIVCRQAVNYWLTEATAGLVSRLLARGGIFAFNTFNEEVGTEPKTRAYQYGAWAFAEVAWRIDDTVHHLQVREQMEPHYTKFRWIPPKEFRELLEPHFDIEEKKEGKTSLYRCVKK
jgi:SAM-dependent methyltransferase